MYDQPTRCRDIILWNLERRENMCAMSTHPFYIRTSTPFHHDMHTHIFFMVQGFVLLKNGDNNKFKL